MVDAAPGVEAAPPPAVDAAPEAEVAPAGDTAPEAEVAPAADSALAPEEKPLDAAQAAPGPAAAPSPEGAEAAPAADFASVPAPPPSDVPSAPPPSPFAEASPSSPPPGPGPVDALAELASLALADGAATRARPASPTALEGLRVALRRVKNQPGWLLARVLSDDEVAERGEKNGVVVVAETIVEQLLKPR